MKPNGAAAEATPQADMTSEYWQQRCAELTAECDQLRRELADLKTDYDAVRKSLISLIREDVEFDEEELRAQAGKGQSLREFLDELKAELKAKGAL
jgi:predicted nuclease with TOPRIM domain